MGIAIDDGRRGPGLTRLWWQEVIRDGVIMAASGFSSHKAFNLLYAFVSHLNVVNMYQWSLVVGWGWWGGCGAVPTAERDWMVDVTQTIWAMDPEPHVNHTAGSNPSTECIPLLLCSVPGIRSVLYWIGRVWGPGRGVGPPGHKASCHRMLWTWCPPLHGGSQPTPPPCLSLNYCCCNKPLTF